MLNYSRWGLIPFLVCAAALGGAPTQPQPQTQPLTPEEKTSIREAISKEAEVMWGGLYADLQIRYRNRPIPYLLELLDDAPTMRERTVLFNMLGLLRAKAVGSRAIAFIELPLPEVIDEDWDLAIRAAIRVLGGLSSASAQEYLLKLTSTDYWKSRNAQPSRPWYPAESARSADFLRREYQRDALSAYLSAGTEEGLARVRSWQGLPEELRDMQEAYVKYAEKQVENRKGGKKVRLKDGRVVRQVTVEIP